MTQWNLSSWYYMFDCCQRKTHPLAVGWGQNSRGRSPASRATLGNTPKNSSGYWYILWKRITACGSEGETRTPTTSFRTNSLLGLMWFCQLNYSAKLLEHSSASRLCFFAVIVKRIFVSIHSLYKFLIGVVIALLWGWISPTHTSVSFLIVQQAQAQKAQMAEIIRARISLLLTATMKTPQQVTAKTTAKSVRKM